MISAVTTYYDVLSQVNRPDYGDLSIELFNKFSRLAEIAIFDWLTGKDLSGKGNQPAPAPWLTQKNKDWLLPFSAEPEKRHISTGFFPAPKKYSQFESLVRYYSKDGVLKYAPVDLLTASKFSHRLSSRTIGKNTNIAKQVTKAGIVGFELVPAEGDYELSYLRLPNFASLVAVEDVVYKTQVPSEDRSKHYEWPEEVATVLIHNISQRFAVHARQQDAMGMNGAANDMGR